MKTKADWLANVLDQTLDCIFIFDAQTLLFTYVNDGAQHQTGYTENELLTLTPVHIKPHFTRESLQALLQPLIERLEQSLVFQTVHKHKDGHEIPVEIFLQYITFGEIRPSFVAVVRDITARNRTEEALRTSEARFRVLAQNAPIGILQTDASGACSFVNQRFTSITGMEQSDALGTGWMSSLHPSDVLQIQELWQTLVTTNTPFELDYRFLHKNGSEIWVERLIWFY